MYPREKQFADLLTKQNFQWAYHPKRFKVKDSHYTPDFYLFNEKLYIEVVGTRQAYHLNKNKIAEFRKIYPNIYLIIVDYKGRFYPFPRSANFTKNSIGGIDIEKNRNIIIK